MNVNPQEYASSEAKRILGELAPYFAELEKRALEDMVRTPTADKRSDRKRRCLVERIKVIRDVQAQLHSIIMVGAQSARVSRVA